MSRATWRAPAPPGSVAIADMPCTLLRDDKYQYNHDLMHKGDYYHALHNDDPDLFYNGGGKLCIKEGNDDADRLDAEFKRIEHQAKELKDQAEQLESRAKAKREHAKELEKSLSNLGEGTAWGYFAPI